MRERLGAIFDLDGTLLDSMQVWNDVDVTFLANRGIALPDDYQKMITPMETREAAVYTIERFHLNEDPDALVREWFDMVRDLYHHEVMLKPYAYEYVKQLKAQGMRLGVATSSDRELFLPTLERNGIMDCFDAIVTAKDVARGKGFPDIYLKAAELIGVTPDTCEVYEDIIQGVRVAKSAGFYTIGVHEAGNSEDAHILREEADRYIDSFRECLEWS